MKRTSASITSFYAVLQGLYWVTYGLMFNYASVFLLDRGFSNSRIGFVLGASYAFSACIQPLFAALVSRMNVRLSSAMACVYGSIGILAAVNLVLPLNGTALVCVMVAMLTLQSAMQPSMNSLHRGDELAGVPVNFGLARGMGSAAFALMSFTVGQILNRVKPQILPAFYLSTVALMFIGLAIFRSPSIGNGGAREKSASQSGLMRRYPRFGLFLIGLVLLATVHIFIDNFMLQIMHSVGGDSGNLGIAIAVAAITELPAMVVYGKLSRRLDGSMLLRAAGWLWFVKDALALIAPRPEIIYITEIMQFCSYAIYVPATVDYIARTLPETDFLKGQALAGSAFTMGSLLATLIGGRMIDAFGVKAALGYLLIFAFIGAVLFGVAIPRTRRSEEK